MIRLTPIKRHNAGEFLHLKVHESQQQFGDFDYADRLIDAYLEWATNGWQPYVFGITFGESTAVGFIKISYELAENSEYANNDLNYFNIDVFWIDKEHQGKGYGRIVMQEVLKLLKTMPQGESAGCIFLDYAPENEAARKLFTSFGFVETGEIHDGCTCARLVL
ncbi:MAG: GNAT family N-acetyltransferase [Defluviitaleaceae bacterium]|nr:GNAT family N-acetyltransferase [Defluviitaleaceae bacterium]